MIQRVQSLFLVLAAACMALLFLDSMSFLSVEAPSNTAVSEPMLANGIFETNDHIILLVLVILAVAIPAVVVLLFRNRRLQLKLTRVTIALVAMIIALTIILFMQAYKAVPVGTEITVEYGFLSPVLAIIFLVLAIRYISKDEKLVRSADRLR